MWTLAGCTTWSPLAHFSVASSALFSRGVARFWPWPSPFQQWKSLTIQLPLSPVKRPSSEDLRVTWGAYLSSSWCKSAQVSPKAAWKPWCFLGPPTAQHTRLGQESWPDTRAQHVPHQWCSHRTSIFMAGPGTQELQNTHSISLRLFFQGYKTCISFSPNKDRQFLLLNLSQVWLAKAAPGPQVNFTTILKPCFPSTPYDLIYCRDYSLCHPLNSTLCYKHSSGDLHSPIL